MKAAYYVNTDDKKDTERLLKTALALYKVDHPDAKTFEDKVRRIVRGKIKAEGK
jgi:hypothetical protein